MEKKVVIFCSASTKINPKYDATAREIVRALHALGYTVVSGGGAVGLMGAVTGESALVGGRHIAVLPEFMRGLENPVVKEVIWTETMSERKQEMRKGTVAAIALPGGIGTIDELAETHTLRKLNKYPGALYAFNQDGFFDPYKAMMDHFVAEGTLEPKDRDLVKYPSTPEELIAYFK